MNFWDIFSFFFWSYVFISYLLVLFSIVGDIMRDHELNGWLKAVWIIFLIFVPILTALVYLIARGRGMSERHFASVQQARSQTDSYIRSVASSSPADEITKAKMLLDSQAISQTEFEELKAATISKVNHPTPV